MKSRVHKAEDLRVGDRVCLVRDIWDGDGADQPRHIVGRMRDVVVIRGFGSPGGYEFLVSHPEITDNSFGVNRDEIGPPENWILPPENWILE